MILAGQPDRIGQGRLGHERLVATRSANMCGAPGSFELRAVFEQTVNLGHEKSDHSE